MAATQSILQASGAHAHADGERCPFCDQPIPNEKLAEIERRIEAKERERIGAVTERLKEQFARERRDAEVKAKAELEAARSEAVKAAEAAVVERLAAAEGLHAAALAENAALKAAQELALKSHAEQLRQSLEQERIAAVQSEQAKAFEEKQKFQSKILELQRQLENKTAQDLGNGAEVDLFEALKAEFPEDRISRVDKGVAGADVIHDIYHNGRLCGRMVYDSKNRGAWRNDYVGKLRQDQAEANADHAVLASKVFPAGVRELHIQDGVLIVAPARVLVLAHVLRRHVIQTHALRLGNEARAQKSEALYAFIMSERCGQLLSSIDLHAEDMADLDRKEEKAHQATWKRRAELIRSVQRAHVDLTSEIERIIGTRSQ
jgi:hypothetical protein